MTFANIFITLLIIYYYFTEIIYYFCTFVVILFLYLSSKTQTMASTNYSERIAELMRIKGISKTELANRVDIKKQNVNILLETNNIEKLIGISKALGVSLNDIVGESAPEVKGCIVYQGIVHPINSKQDIEDILKTID